ncbi:phage baseplate protein [Desulfovibrio psychrotolerans]|uniref:Dit-like phage tail protein N-terminal domain-containing protein n=1 Tax=Desulfovibrio psychrotolerans TaxID=415242 RepID=A0A7J0BYE3_9BACT|nr:hypothetical protein [Desulfovibrio psychrotolerans]GFM38004.1 hypothetical protein DSM19430T_26880 [Desulfovibrio psychrotolerans]
MSDVLSKSSGPVLLRPTRSIGGLYPDVVVEESHEDALQVTEHPVEQGAAISDHAFKKPATVVIRGGVSDASAENTGGERRSVEFYNTLLELQKSRELFDLVTGKRLYRNMLLETLSTVTDNAGEHALMFTAACREVVVVTTRTTTVPPRSRHAQPGKTGATSDAGQKQPRQSILKGGFG